MAGRLCLQQSEAANHGAPWCAVVEQFVPFPPPLPNGEFLLLDLPARTFQSIRQTKQWEMQYSVIPVTSSYEKYMWLTWGYFTTLFQLYEHM
jgi:hypothetical protein